MPDSNPTSSFVRRLLKKLQEAYPDAKCALNFESPLQLLIGTILAAQCTDARVNQITPGLFAKYPNAASFAKVSPGELEKDIHSTGFFRNKAKNIVACCQRIVSEYGGEVPNTMEDLLTLAGIGRKSANVILSESFGIPGITVDTHLGRLSRRIGLTVNTHPEKVERDLMVLLPRKHWIAFNHRIIIHGRRVCHSRKPDCDGCFLKRMCPKMGVSGKPEGAVKKG